MPNPNPPRDPDDRVTQLWPLWADVACGTVAGFLVITFIFAVVKMGASK